MDLLFLQAPCDYHLVNGYVLTIRDYSPCSLPHQDIAISRQSFDTLRLFILAKSEWTLFPADQQPTRDALNACYMIAECGCVANFRELEGKVFYRTYDEPKDDEDEQIQEIFGAAWLRENKTERREMNDLLTKCNILPFQPCSFPWLDDMEVEFRYNHHGKGWEYRCVQKVWGERTVVNRDLVDLAKLYAPIRDLHWSRCLVKLACFLSSILVPDLIELVATYV